MDLDRTIDRLLWLEAQGLQIARAARRDAGAVASVVVAVVRIVAFLS